MKTQRKLTEIERLFVQEAKEGGFSVAYDDDGSPFALGATDTDNLFSMQVDQVKQPDGGACYTVHV